MPFVYTTNLAEVRDLAGKQARMAGLPDERVIDFVIAISEVAGNTVRHARTPGLMEIWSDTREIVCEMRDGGVITDPKAGLAPPPADADGGHGLWLVHRVCDRVDLRSGPDGTVIRMYMSLPPAGTGLSGTEPAVVQVPRRWTRTVVLLGQLPRSLTSS